MIMFSNQSNVLIHLTKLLSLFKITLHGAGQELEGGWGVFVCHGGRFFGRLGEGLEIKLYHVFIYLHDCSVTMTVQPSYETKPMYSSEEIWRMRTRYAPISHDLGREWGTHELRTEPRPRLVEIWRARARYVFVWPDLLRQLPSGQIWFEQVC